MRILVRSQNKKWFGTMGDICATKDNDSEWTIVNNGDVVLGYYENEERCISVLDDLQKLVDYYKTDPLLIINMPKE